MEKQIENLMEKLKISREEAIDIIESDKAIDKGEKLFELTEEQKKAEKKARITTGKNRVDAYGKKVTKDKKINADKVNLISLLAEAIGDAGGTVKTIVNTEREFEFEYKGVKYKIVMSVPRK